MPQRIIDLDAALPAGIDVKCGGKIYKLPGDIAVPDYLEIARLGEKLSTSAEDALADLLEELYDRVLDLFRIEQPDLEELPLGPQALANLLLQLYNAAPPDAPEAAPSRPRKGGTRSTARKRTTRSRSSR